LIKFRIYSLIADNLLAFKYYIVPRFVIHPESCCLLLAISGTVYSDVSTTRLSVASKAYYFAFYCCGMRMTRTL